MSKSGIPPGRWQQIDELFGRVLEQPIDKQISYLEEAVGEDRALFEAVMELLAAEAEAEERLGDSVTNFAEALLPGLREKLAITEEDQTIGPYRIVKEIGRGGMGAVYLAERHEPQFQHCVAIKRIKRGMDTDDIIQRFKYERQILASLQHPNIARLMDGGVSNDQPYFVMEYVEGTSITEYCDQEKLDVDARLALFQSVCSAVQHAHKNLVVHRDLKPSNIMVTPEGEVKLLDFGIAKVLSPDSLPMTAPETHTGYRVMTPEYAGPEQVSGKPVTTATDVYALGVILYELLTGRRPFARPRTSASAASQPEKPSTAVTRAVSAYQEASTLGAVSPRAISEARSSTTERLQRRLRGDLDIIILKALEVEPERRYQSAEQFLEDIKRHLAGLPVQAQPPTFRYRARKFVARHRYGVSVAAILVVMLTGFAGAMAYQQAQTAIERDKAEAVATFLEGLFTAADPASAESGRPDTLRARDLLARGVQRLAEERDASPVVQARIMTVIGNVYRSLALYEEADSLLSGALWLRKSYASSRDVELAESHHALGTLRMGQGRFEAADSLFELALSARRSFGQPELIIETLAERAYVQQRFGAYDRSEDLLAEAIDLARSSVGEGDPLYLDVMNKLAVLYEDISEYEEAERILKEVLALQQDTYGPIHSRVASTMNNLSLVLRDQEKFEEAEPYAHDARVVNQMLYGGDHHTVAANLENLGAILMGQGRLVEAEHAYREALDIFTRTLGEYHEKTGFTKTHLAELMRKKGNLDQAARIYEDVLDHVLDVDPDNPGVGIISALLANVYLDDEEHARAEQMYLQALDAMRTLFPPDHIRIGRALHGLGVCLTRQGRFEEAETALFEAMDIFTKKEQHLDRVKSALFDLYKAWGKEFKATAYRANL